MLFIVPGWEGIEPGTINLSSDGSPYVGGITRQSRGDAQAVGYGTREQDSCTPDCAQGTFSGTPAAIVPSDPRDGYWTQMTITEGSQTITVIYRTDGWAQGAS